VYVITNHRKICDISAVFIVLFFGSAKKDRFSEFIPKEKVT
jgi:hypothetical protein